MCYNNCPHFSHNPPPEGRCTLPSGAKCVEEEEEEEELEELDTCPYCFVYIDDDEDEEYCLNCGEIL